ncbi:MAG: hypothetical protein RR651_00640, partial [Lysinibacillus sp.]
TSEYKKDRVVADHKLGFDIEGVSGKLIIAEKGEIVKKVSMPSDAKVIDLGGMDRAELEQYFYEELMPSVEEWIYQYQEQLESIFY